jgi:hypothetical protein
MIDPDIGTDVAVANQRRHRDQLPPKLTLFVIVITETE